MTKDLVQEYLMAKADFDDAAHCLVATGQLIFRVGRALMRSPPNLVIIDAKQPSPLVFGQAISISESEWPTADELKSALASYGQARQKAEERYSALSPAVQSSVQAPGTR